MSDSAVFVQQYKGIEDGFAINKREIQRYAGYFRTDIGFDEELDRVMVHGVLHLIGYDDHNEEDIKVMRSKENYYLELKKQLESC